MNITFYNKSDKALCVKYNSTVKKILPYSTLKTDFEYLDDEIEIYKANSQKSFKERTKTEFSLKEMNPKYLSFNILYATYLKSVIKINKKIKKKIYRETEEKEFSTILS